MNQKKSIALTTTFVGLVCGFVLTQQQAAAAAINAPDPTATSMVAPQSTLTTKSAKSNEPNPNEQLVNQQTSTQKAVTNTDIGSETVNQNQIPRTQSTVSPATNISKEPATSNNNPTTSAQPQQETVAQNTAATSSANSANEATQPVSQPTVPATPQATDSTNNVNTASATTDPQVETIAQGTWGTSKWEYTHQGDDYILHFHAGTLGASSHGYVDRNNYFLGSIGKSPEIFNGNWQWNEELTQIIIDPGVIANQDSSYLFGDLRNLQKIIGLANLDTANVTNMSKMFESYQGASLDLSHFDTSNVTNMAGMFEFYKGPQLDFSHLNTANVTNMSEMFELCDLTNLDLSNFNTANVTDMSYMFEDYQGASLDFSNFNTAKVTNMSHMLYGCSGLTNLDLSNFNTAKVIDMCQMFDGCSGLTSLNLSNWNNENVTYMSWMFNDCSSLTNLNLSNFHTTNVTDMSWMFSGCSSLTSLDLSSFNTANVTDMSYMFAGCSGLAKLDLSHFNTANVTDMCQMFWGCNNLTNLDISNFNTANVKNMFEMFEYDSSLTKLDLSHFNTANVTDMRNLEGMFRYCNSLNHLILGSKTILTTDTGLPNVPETGAKIPGTNRVVVSPYWVATSGYQQGHKYTSNDLMGLTGRDQVTTYDWDSKPAFTQTTETKTKDRTIVIHQPDGNTKTEIQSVMISRTITLNADGSKTYGNWSSAQWDGYALPEFAGYTASVSQIPAQTVDGNTEDQTIDVYYAPQEQTVEIQYLANGQIVGTQKITGYTGDTIMPNYHAPQGYEITSLTPATITIDGSGKQIIQVQVSPKLNDSVEHKTLTRTINLHLPDGTMRVSKQTALLERQVTINAVTGEKIYGAWNTGDWKALNVPTLAGYTASQDQVAAQQVTGEDTDQTVDVYYTPTN